MTNALYAVDKTLSPNDGMFHGNIEHCFSCGEFALRVILAAISLAGIETPKQILDFGASAGRVSLVKGCISRFQNSRL